MSAKTLGHLKIGANPCSFLALWGEENKVMKDDDILILPLHYTGDISSPIVMMIILILWCPVALIWLLVRWLRS